MPTEEDMSSGQISFNQVAQLMNKFSKVGWDAVRITMLGQANEVQFRAIEAMLASRVNPLTQVGIVSEGEIILRDFFLKTTRFSGQLDFNVLFLEAATPNPVQSFETTIGYSDLLEHVSDEELVKCFPKRFIFEDVDCFLLCLARLVQVQSNGRSGPLANSTVLTNDFNLFYVRVNEKIMVVGVRWDMGYWRIEVWPFGRRQASGYRVFSAVV